MNKVVLNFALNQSIEIIIFIYNIAGKQIKHYSQTIIQNNSNLELDFSDMAVGTYFIVVKSTNGILHKEFKCKK